MGMTLDINEIKIGQRVRSPDDDEGVVTDIDYDAELVGVMWQLPNGNTDYDEIDPEDLEPIE